VGGQGTTQQPHLSLVGLDQAGDDRDGRGLAGTVGSEQAVGLPRRDVEADVTYRFDVAEALADAVDLQDRFDGSPPRGDLAPPPVRR
jgi:hypothetical protein